MDGAFEQLQPSSAFEVELTKDISAESAFQAIGRACVEQIQVNERVLRHAGAPEALHQIRVGLRRWRTVLSVFESLLSDRGEATRTELKWLAGELDEARDLDVFTQSLVEGLPAGTPDEGLDLLKQAAAAARARAYDRAAGAITSERYHRLLWEGARAIEAPGWEVANHAPQARGLVRAALARRREKVAKGGRHLAKLDPQGRHALRIEAKKARYAAEMFAPLFAKPKRARRYGKALKDLQDALGEMNDIEVGKDLARRLAGEAGAPEAGFAAGLIAGSRLGREAALMADVAAAYARFLKVDPYW